jgi:hypothetical protein
MRHAAFMTFCLWWGKLGRFLDRFQNKEWRNKKRKRGVLCMCKKLWANMSWVDFKLIEDWKSIWIIFEWNFVISEIIVVSVKCCHLSKTSTYWFLLIVQNISHLGKNCLLVKNVSPRYYLIPSVKSHHLSKILSSQ